LSKYDPLWQYVAARQEEKFTLSFGEIAEIAGVPMDHSFLQYKKELTPYGYQLGKISMKKESVEFVKLQS